MEPVIFVDSLSGFFRVVNVAFRDVGTFYINLKEQNPNDNISIFLRSIQIDFVVINSFFLK